ncbi:response regulator [Pelotalea chapellei]|uniref:Response regulator n=1 Tax=Pelotalea chapellei TaxID=44671 RepID=A0ABS5U3H9_9BACT|nr:response regulator [Pelotalea chapellei]MBT1070231.1 response regulator [Pelotalea chapellei]
MKQSQAEGNSVGTMGITEVLIVDDDSDCLQILKAYLAVEGYRVTCASDGFEALTVLKTGFFSLMLTDYNMPGLNGLELCEEARKIKPGLIMIMMTGATLNRLQADAFRLGISSLLAKPLDFSELLGVVRKLSPITPVDSTLPIGATLIR